MGEGARGGAMFLGNRRMRDTQGREAPSPRRQNHRAAACQGWLWLVGARNVPKLCVLKSSFSFFVRSMWRASVRSV